MRTDIMGITAALLAVACNSKAPTDDRWNVLGRAGAGEANTIKVVCQRSDTEYETGTGFIVAAGWVVTVKHVVKGCGPEQIFMLTRRGEHPKRASRVVVSDAQDLAIIAPSEPLESELTISPDGIPPSGTTLVFWGFPSAYGGINPLLSTAYVAGRSPLVPGGPEMLWFSGLSNNGCSGGPLMSPRTGQVVGIVKGQLRARSANYTLPTLENSIAEIEGVDLGNVDAADAEGQTREFPRARLLRHTLQTLHEQLQLGVSIAVPSTDLLALMSKAGAP